MSHLGIFLFYMPHLLFLANSLYTFVHNKKLTTYLTRVTLIKILNNGINSSFYGRHRWYAR